MTNETLNVAVSTVDLLVKEKLGQVQALEAKVQALRLTEQELQGRIDVLKPELQRREDFDKLVQRARKFAGE